jgi:hypothetical protein
MTAGKDQPQAVILDAFTVQFITGISHELYFSIFGQRLKPGTAADDIDPLEAPGRHQPGPRIARYAVTRPLLQRCPERVMQ